MRKFMETYKFQPVEEGYTPTVFGGSSLRKVRPVEGAKEYLYVMKSEGKIHCNYILDTSRRVLWASISYPDWSGD